MRRPALREVVRLVLLVTVVRVVRVVRPVVVTAAPVVQPAAVIVATGGRQGIVDRVRPEEIVTIEIGRRAHR
jgi:hypothetical protein